MQWPFGELDGEEEEEDSRGQPSTKCLANGNCSAGKILESRLASAVGGRMGNQGSGRRGGGEFRIRERGK